MESENNEQLLNEVRQICEQYRAEVPGRRRAWPQSVRERIFEVRKSGAPWKRIAEVTEIPVHTLYQWGSSRKKGSKFRQLTVVTEKSIVSGRKSATGDKSEKSATVTVTVGDVRVEGLSVADAIQFVRLIRA